MDDLRPHLSVWRVVRTGNREIIDGLVRPESRGPASDLVAALGRWPGRWYWSDDAKTRVVLVRAVRERNPRWVLHILLFMLTLLCSMGAGAVLLGGWSPESGSGLLGSVLAAGQYFVGIALGDWRELLPGWAFAVPLLAILLVHELGHYLAARRYAIEASLPYFLPVPPTVSPIGSLGAFIRLRSPVVDRRQLMDVGAAGPLAGFAVALLVLAWGYSTSERIPIVLGSAPSYVALSGYRVFLGESLLTGWLRDLILPGTGAVHLSAPAFAGWVGMFVTSLNLIPLNQFDGGHIVYSLVSKHQRWAGYLTVAVLIWLAQASAMWYVWLGLALLVGRGRVGHPPVLLETSHLSRSRWAMGIISVLVLIVTFVRRPF
jgi:membrane-associated protease RseP (regulator of RpoE activity)